MSDNMLNEDIKTQLREIFNDQLNHPVEIILFIKSQDCESCAHTLELLEEITCLSDRIHFTSYDEDEYPELVQKYQINLAPTLVIAGCEKDELIDYGIRLIGIPVGYEFSSLIQSICMVSRRDSGLTPGNRAVLKGLSKPVNLKVFSTPT